MAPQALLLRAKRVKSRSLFFTRREDIFFPQLQTDAELAAFIVLTRDCTLNVDSKFRGQVPEGDGAKSELRFATEFDDLLPEFLDACVQSRAQTSGP